MRRAYALIACFAALSGGGVANADRYGDYASAWLGDALRHERSTPYWTDMVSRPSWTADPAARGPRTWDPRDQNPWANTYGTPSESRGRSAPPAGGRSVVRMCSCYLPSDARSWDGGPLTDADIARLCRAQCY
jgi:hypothetical protein